MKCKEAAARMVRALVAAPGSAVDAALAEHLRTCLACVKRLATYHSIRDEVRGMAPVEVPEELDELLAEGIRQGLAEGWPADRPPAVPTPERPGGQKALIFIGAVATLIVMTVGLMVLFRGEHEPIPRMGEVILLSGSVEISTPGASKWRDLGRRDFLPAGVRLRTGPDSVLKVRGEGVEWWLAGMSSIALGEPASAELMAGRVYARCTGAAQKPVRLVSANGVLTCRRGEFTASISMKRLRVGCASGQVTVEREEEPRQLSGGQSAMLVNGELSGPVREVRAGQLTHWLKGLDSYDGRHLSARQLASVPLAPERCALPPGVVIEGLEISVLMRGPLVLLNMKLTLRNTGSEPWQGALSPRDVLLPPPLAETAPAAVELAPGEQRTYDLAAVCLLRCRTGFYALGLNPEVWTGREMGRLDLNVTAEADGGFREFNCPALNYRLKKADTVRWSWSGAGVDPRTPLLLEFRPSRAEGVDAVGLETESGVHALVAWRPDPKEEEWVRKGRNVFIAFDGTADFGPGGRAGAHEVLEGLLQFLPPGASTALLAYDGQLRPDPDRLMRHFPARVEALLERLWHFRDGGEGATRDFLHGVIALVSTAEGEGLLLFVTGRDDVGDLAECRAIVDADRLRVAVLQVGADGPARAYRVLCAASGGVALALPGSAAPELAVMDLMANLRRPALTEASVEVRHGPAGVMLPARADFANQPVAALLRVPQRGAASGRFEAWAGGRRMTREFSVGLNPGSILSGPAGGELVRALQGAAGP